MNYLIPDQFVRTEYTIARSRFVSSIQYTSSREKADEFIRSIRTQMSDANHHVYAFRIGFGNSVTEGMSDDREPSGTSGPPTLAVIRGSNIGDITLVTTRFFGGTKLGTGGLVRAYTTSAQLAIASLRTKANVTESTILVSLEYSFYDRVKHLIQSYNINVFDETFMTSVTLTLTIYEGEKNRFLRELAELSAGSIEAIDIS